MEKFKKLYFELQTELDKLDSVRKNWTYFALKRENFVKNIAKQQQKEEEEDLDCDLESIDENHVIRSPLYRW